MRSLILRITLLSYILVIVVVTLTALRPIYSYITFNVVNLENTKAIDTQHMLNILTYQQLLQWWPENSKIRWRLGIFLAKTGELDEAVDILLPLLLSHSTDQTVARSVLSTIISADRVEDALYAYNVLLRNSALLPQFTAYVAWQYLSRDNKLPGDRQDSMLMLADALGLSRFSPGYELLSAHLQSNDFWLSMDGQHLKRVLKWKAQVSGLFNYQQFEQPLKNDEQLVKLQNSVSTLLRIPQEIIVLGPEISVNGEFEIQESCSNVRVALYCCCSAGWSLSFMSTGKIWNRGMFIIGTDKEHFFSGHHALRIDGVIIDEKAELEPARAGVWHSALEIEPNSSYIISFFYQTRDVNTDAFAAYLTTVPITFSPVEKYFPPSPTRWQQVIIILPNRRPHVVTIQPLLRLWSKGTVWIDNFSIRKLDIQRNELIPEIIYHLQ